MLIANHQNQNQPGAIVVVFTIPGCPACEEYIPRVRQIASGYPQVPLHVLDASLDEVTPYADQFAIEATPTTMVLRRPTGALKTEGALEDPHIHYLFGLAAAQR